MTKIQKKIEIARTEIPGCSSLGRTSAEGIRSYLATIYSDVIITLLNSVDDLNKLAIRNPDLVFIGMDAVVTKSVNSSRKDTIVWLTEFLELHGISHTGSGVRAVKLERSKHTAKEAVIAAGLGTAKYITLPKNIKLNTSSVSLRYPLFVKPASLGASSGIDNESLVYDANGLMQKVAKLQARWSDTILIEEYLPGREFSVAVLKDAASGIHTAMPIEIIAEQNSEGQRILSLKAKDDNKEVVLDVTDTVLREKLCTLALGAFAALDGRDYGRIDIRLDSTGAPMFLEANLIPSLLRDYGNFIKASRINANLEYEDVIQTIVDLAFGRTLYNDKPPAMPFASELIHV